MKVLRWLNEHIEEVVLVLLLALISFVMLAQVIARYVLNNSMSWPEEFCRYCYIWTVFLSLGYTIRKGNMLRVGVVMDLFPAMIQRSVKILVDIVMIGLFFVLFRQSLRAVLHIKNITREISSAMQIPMWFMYMATSVGFGLAIVRTIQMTIDDIRHFRDKMESTIESTIKEARAETEMALQDDAAFRQDIAAGGDAR